MAKNSIPDSEIFPHGTEEKTILWAKEQQVTLCGGERLVINGEGHNVIETDTGNRTLTPQETIDFANRLKRDYYSKYFLSRQFENLVILAGAGSSVGVGEGTAIGKTMTELWESTEIALGSEFKTFCDKCNHDINEKDLERLLSVAQVAKIFWRSSTSEVLAIQTLIDKVEICIKDNCNLKLPPSNSAHQILINRITKRKLRYPRVKLFTLNYDTLFEQACQRERAIVVDGFSFSYPREFNGRNYDYDLVIRENSRIKDEENFVPKVIHLYKMHGSIGWKRVDDIIQQTGSEKDSVMIFPRDSKYEETYDKPFFETMARFQAELRKNDTLLITIGSSLYDKHIFTVIKEALSQNHGFQLLVVNRSIRSDGNWDWLRSKARFDSRIVLVAEDFMSFALNYPENTSMSHDERMKLIYESSEEPHH